MSKQHLSAVHLTFRVIHLIENVCLEMNTQDTSGCSRDEQTPVQDIEELVDAPGGEPRVALAAVDGVRLPGASLAIGKDAHVVAVHR